MSLSQGVLAEAAGKAGGRLEGTAGLLEGQGPWCVLGWREASGVASAEPVRRLLAATAWPAGLLPCPPLPQQGWEGMEGASLGLLPGGSKSGL